MTDNLTPAELIYLYLDGEADSFQQTTMFASLATDSDLQQEFSEALSMRRAFEHERNNTKPPLYLTSKVMQDAGILPKAVGASAVGGGLWLWLRRAAVPVGSMMLGAVLTFVGMGWIGPRSNDNSTQTTSAQAQVKQNKNPNQSAIAAALPKGEEGRIPSYAKEIAVAPSAPRSTTRRTERSTEYAAYEEKKPLSVLPTMTEQGKVERVIENDDNGETFIAQKNQLTPVSSYYSPAQSRRMSMITVQDQLSFSKVKTSDFTVQLNNVAGVHIMGAGNASAVSLGSGLSGSVMYNISQSFSAGINYQEAASFSAEDITSSGVSLQNPTLRLYGLSALWQPNAAIAGLPIYTGVNINYSSNTGAPIYVVGINFGVSYPLASTVTLNSGFAFDNMIYTNQAGTLTVPRKVSFVFGLGYNPF